MNPTHTLIHKKWNKSLFALSILRLQHPGVFLSIKDTNYSHCLLYPLSSSIYLIDSKPLLQPAVLRWNVTCVKLTPVTRASAVTRHQKPSCTECISRQLPQGAPFKTELKTEEGGEKNKRRDMNENVWVCCLIFARRPKPLKSKEWGIPVKKRACHRRWHMIENCVTRYHICHFSAISLKNPGDFLQEINQQIFSTHPTLQSRSYTPFLAACSQRRTAGFISAITCKYVWCHPEGDCTSLGLAVEWLETWSCLMRIRDDFCPPEGFRGVQQHAALEHFIFVTFLMDETF